MTQAQTRMLVKDGYGVLLFDRRGGGVSQGDGNMFGWRGERDIFAALDCLEQLTDVIRPHEWAGSASPSGAN